MAAVGNECMFQKSRYCQYSHEKETTNIWGSDHTRYLTGFLYTTCINSNIILPLKMNRYLLNLQTWVFIFTLFILIYISDIYYEYDTIYFRDHLWISEWTCLCVYVQIPSLELQTSCRYEFCVFILPSLRSSKAVWSSYLLNLINAQGRPDWQCDDEILPKPLDNGSRQSPPSSQKNIKIPECRPEWLGLVTPSLHTLRIPRTLVFCDWSMLHAAVLTIAGRVLLRHRCVRALGSSSELERELACLRLEFRTGNHFLLKLAVQQCLSASKSWERSK